jgi:hypothetical protein
VRRAARVVQAEVERLGEEHRLDGAAGGCLHDGWRAPRQPRCLAAAVTMGREAYDARRESPISLGGSRERVNPAGRRCRRYKSS